MEYFFENLEKEKYYTVMTMNSSLDFRALLCTIKNVALKRMLQNIGLLDPI